MLASVSWLRRHWYLAWSRGKIIDPHYLGVHAIGKLMKRYAPQMRGRFLDVGCGERPYDSLLKDRVEFHCALDYGPGRAQRGIRKPIDVNADALALPFAAATFDTVMSHSVIEHVVDPFVYISELSRVLKPGGRLYLSGPGICPVHSGPYDFFRLTEYAYRHYLALNKLAIERIEYVGFTGTVLARFLGMALLYRIWQRAGILGRALRILLLQLLHFAVTVLNLLGALLNWAVRDPADCPHYFIVAVKERGEGASP